MGLSSGCSESKTINMEGHKEIFDNIVTEVKRLQSQGQPCQRSDVRWLDSDVIIINYLI